MKEIDVSASVARLTGTVIDAEMAQAIVALATENATQAAEMAKLRAEVVTLRWSCARGLARRPPGRDR